MEIVIAYCVKNKPLMACYTYIFRNTLYICTLPITEPRIVKQICIYYNCHPQLFSIYETTNTLKLLVIYALSAIFTSVRVIIAFVNLIIPIAISMSRIGFVRGFKWSCRRANRFFYSKKMLFLLLCFLYVKRLMLLVFYF